MRSLVRHAAVVSSLGALACGRSVATEQAPAASASSPAPAATVSSARDPFQPEFVTFYSGLLALGGFLYRPDGPGPFPAVVFNHGSERLPGWKPDQAKFYVAHGFVLFVPHRRGQGRSKAAGVDINTVFDRGNPDSPAFTDELVAQSDDVVAAIGYVASLPYVDKGRIATAGCSLGGIEALLVAERGAGIVAAVDFAGASITWASSAPLRRRMMAAARNAKVPVFFIQAENDHDTAPSRVLSEEMKQAGKPMRVHIFPPNGRTPEQGHAFCMGGERPLWGDEVLAFLAEAMRR